MEHLACFTPGALWLAAHAQSPTIDTSSIFSAEQCEKLAEDLMFTCWQMSVPMYTLWFSANTDTMFICVYLFARRYEQTETGIGPEQIQFPQARSLRRATGLNGKDFSVSKSMPWSTMRPEVVESLYVAYHLTGDTKYQVGWC